MAVFFAGVIVAIAVAWSALTVARQIASARESAARGRALQLLELFTTAIAAADADPRALLVWQPIAHAARQLFPDECTALDRAAQSAFPFSRDQIQTAH